MKIALISDVHGNLPALEAVLMDIDQQDIDELICLGDVATIGPNPKEVIERIRTLNCPCIMGNHDAALLDMDNLNKYQIAPPLHSTLTWCLEQLDENDLFFLRSFKSAIEKSLTPGIELLCYHGSPQSNTDIILSTSEDSILDNILNQHETKIYVGGHTHLQMHRQYKDKLFLNPGSVGSAFPRFFKPGETPTLLPQAEYAVLSVENGYVNVTMRQIPFDTESLKKTISKSDIPVKEWWFAQYC